MTGGTSVFSAAGPAAGYYYQARFALAESLRLAYGDPGIEVSIERLDDVAFETNGTALELLQTKHHLSKKGQLSDGSTDLWKTLRVWAEAIKKDPSISQRTRLALVTTAEAPAGSAASFLRPEPEGNRDAKRADSLLAAAAATSQNKELEAAIAAFLALTPDMRLAMVSSVQVLDASPNLLDLEAVIEERLRLISPRGQITKAREELEGWWWPRICRALGSGPSSIPILELEAKLDDIREAMRRDALPVEMEYADPTADALTALSEMRFVRQLRMVGLSGRRLDNAKRDYYRAFAQRSRWARLSLLFDGEVANFEKSLIEEWEPRFDQMCDGLSGGATEGDIRRAGQNLYGWVETDARLPFRTVTKRFLTVGSYHMLADEIRIGWHRDYASVTAGTTGDAEKEKEESYAG